ncbi:MAG: metalloregulator ArsR/SmtB family transcription factor [Nanoarchaeota archaeon]|nr:metalloregulator ArsR/SmtB family transcription factor [Nanoarchaeota archaeon]MBU1051715.1 metalloregulator ArsR/SmtB family transcription factor [Nanoarchaeota archaeon]MBU1988292.1 metalloregulator ArsR/SmtB family transcription factor [Nanoarchaeota archaeon]
MINKSILKSCHSEGYTNEELYAAYKIFFGTLVSEPRLKIINLLRKGKKNVSEIVEEFGMDQTAVSHNLARLRECGFITLETEGKYRYYALNGKTIKPLMEIIEKHMAGNCIHILRSQKSKEEK